MTVAAYLTSTMQETSTKFFKHLSIIQQREVYSEKLYFVFYIVLLITVWSYRMYIYIFHSHRDPVTLQLSVALENVYGPRAFFPISSQPHFQ